MTLTRIRFSILVVTAYAATACTAAAPSPSGAILPESYAGMAECGPAPFPDVLPALAQVMEAEAMITQLAGHTPGLEEALFAIRFEPDGKPAPTVPLESAFSLAVADSQAEMVTAHVTQQPPGPVWGVRLRITSTPLPRVLLERSVFCPPRLDQSTLRIPFAANGAAGELEEARRPEPPLVRVLVDRDGRVVEVRILRSSGSSTVDRTFEDGLRSARFRPALLDDTPVPAWYEIRPP
jgi:TonB family protein